MRRLFVLAAVVLVAGAAPAWAHEEISPSSVPTGRPAYLILSAANEKRVDLTKVTVTAPASGQFGHATRDPAGWTANLTHTVITWTGGAVKPSRFEQFGFDIEGFGQPGTVLYKVNLAYADGSTEVVDVPVVAVVDGSAPPVASPGTTVAASGDGDSDSGESRANLALGLSVLAVLGAIASFLAGRRFGPGRYGGIGADGPGRRWAGLVRHRIRTVVGMALARWAIPRPALAHRGHNHCTSSDSFTTLGIGTFLGLMLFRPWRRSAMNRTGRASRWLLPGLLASVVTLGACGGDAGPSAPRPSTTARLEITQPTPNQNLPTTFSLNLNLVGAKVVDADKVTGTLRGDEGHIHVTLDGKLISMTYGLTQELKDIGTGPHNLQAEFVATDHAPFSNRVIVAVAFNVTPSTPAPASPS